jgi:hypothetical protein
VLFEHGGITEVVEDPETGVVDQDVKRLDALDGRVDLRPVGHVHDERGDTLIGVSERLARRRVDPVCPSLQSLVNQGPPDPTVGPGDKYCAACDGHVPPLWS